MYMQMERNSFFHSCCLLLWFVAFSAAADVLNFEQIAVANDDQRNLVASSNRVWIRNSVQSISFHTLARTTDNFDGTMYGQLLDNKQQESRPIYTIDTNGQRSSSFEVSNSGDFLSLLSTPFGIYGFHHLESPQPASTRFIEFKQNQSTGELSIVSVKNMDWSALGGLWTPCAGSISPWGTHLGSEEYPPDAKSFELATSLANIDTTASSSKVITNFMRYFDLYGTPTSPNDLTLDIVRSHFRPYRYGFTTEMNVTSTGEYTVAKHYSMGRFSHELSVCLADKTTCFLTDDASTNGGFFMFIADIPGDLSRGRLYAAKMSHNNSIGSQLLGFDVEWVPLYNESVSDFDVQPFLDASFTDLIDYVPFDDSAAEHCPEGYSSYNLEGLSRECIRIKPGMEKIASVLEARRVAAIRNATLEFSKWEGISFSPERNALFTALTQIRYGMEDQRKKGQVNTMYDVGGPNHIRAAYNPCGCVFELSLQSDQRDVFGFRILSGYVPSSMRDLICGSPVGGSVQDGTDSCNLSLPANPDNVAWASDFDTLFIAEDSDYHVNNVLWAYSYSSKELKRILSTPEEAESSAVYWVPNLINNNGWSYILSSVQHPGLASGGDGIIGYIGPIRISTENSGELILSLGEARFEPIAAATVLQRDAILSTESISTFDSIQPLAFRTMAKSGQVFMGQVYGQLTNAMGQPIYRIGDDGKKTSVPHISDDGDFLSLLVKPFGIYGFQHFESPQPGITEFIQFSQDDLTGRLSIVNVSHVSWSKFGGLWSPCAGSITPWGSHLGSEEYPPDARNFQQASSIAELGLDSDDNEMLTDFMRYYDMYGKTSAENDLKLSTIKKMIRPYRYGFVTELNVVSPGQYSITKHYAMGRFSHELAYCLPDQRTCFMTDDGTNCGFYMFVADVRGDLRSGRLYAARMTHDFTRGAMSFDLEWIPLHTTSMKDEDIAGSVNASFSDLMDYAPFDSTKLNPCPAGYTPFNLRGIAKECLKIKQGKKGLASVLETRRVAGMLGATTEFTNWEGLTYSAERGLLFTSLSTVRYGMEDYQKLGTPSRTYDEAGPNHIRAPYNPCGCVFELELTSDVVDTGGASISSKSVPSKMKDILCGRPAAGGDVIGELQKSANSCDIDLPSNPDNVAWMSGLDTLLIAEDSDYRVNNVLWAYSYGRGELQRIISTPFGAESSAPYWIPNLVNNNGWSYIISSVQHPGPGAGSRSSIGYLGPIRIQRAGTDVSISTPVPTANSSDPKNVTVHYEPLRNFIIGSMALLYDTDTQMTDAQVTKAVESAFAYAVRQRIKIACTASVVGWCSTSGLLCEFPQVSARRHSASGARSREEPRLRSIVEWRIGTGHRRSVLEDRDAVAHLIVRREDGGPLTNAVAGYMNGTGSSSFFTTFRTALISRGMKPSSTYWVYYPRFCPTEDVSMQCNLTDVREKVAASTFTFDFVLGEMPDFDIDRDGFTVWSTLGGMALGGAVLFLAVRCQQWRVLKQRKTAPKRVGDDELED